MIANYSLIHQKSQVLRAKKKFSQNFLEDEFYLKKITQSLQIKPSDTIIEIGPGSGNLTKYLIDQTDSYHGIEIDGDLVTLLNQRFGTKKNFRLHHCDFLKFNLADFDQKIQSNDKKIKIVSNLPYHLTSAILFKLFNQRIITEMVLMMQKEVAERLVSEVNQKSYSRLTVISQFHADIEYLFQVPKEAFFPMPKVQSAVLRFCLKTIELNDLKGFEKFVQICFHQKRKKIANNLKSSLSKNLYQAILEKSEIDFNQRAESIDVNDYLKLFNLYQSLSD